MEYARYRTPTKVMKRMPQKLQPRRVDVACYIWPAARSKSTANNAPSGVSSCLK
jgi:hypothetical protein